MKHTFLVLLASWIWATPNTLSAQQSPQLVIEGEKLLRYVLLKEPQSVNARLSLAKSCCANGRLSEVLSLASEALDLAQAQRQNDFAPEAAKVLAQLQTNAAKAN